MKLISVNASPFVRKARILVHELGLQERVVVRDIGMVSPISNTQELNAVNPLGLIPALELENGEALYDSTVICEYLNDLVDGPFFPLESVRRFRTLGLQALGNGILELSVALRYETAMRPPALQWQDWIDHQQQKITRGLDALEARCEQFEAPPLIGEITAACVLGYRDFRYPDDDWRPGRPRLVDWYETMMQRDSLRLTQPE